MTGDEFRRLALEMPEAVEHTHNHHPDFRVRKKIFATLGFPDQKSGMVKLRPAQQEKLVAALPEIFRPANGAWGRRGSTLINLEVIDVETARGTIHMAWKNIAI